MIASTPEAPERRGEPASPTVLPPAAPPATYPAEREADVALQDGTTVHVRPVRPDDGPGLLRFLKALSPESLSLRFFSAGVDLEAEARRDAQVDYHDRFGLVATVGPEARIIAHASYTVIDRPGIAPAHDESDRLPSFPRGAIPRQEGRAEVAMAVADSYQGRGVGTILLGHLAEVAAAHGITIFEASVLPHNHRMIDVFRQSGFPVQVRSDAGLLRVAFPTSLTEAAIEQFERREQIAAANALRAILYPRSVAVIGASRRRGTVGGEVFHNLLASEFAGPVYPVNSSAEVVQCVPAYPSVEAVPGPVDLAIIAVPAAQVLSVAEACGRKGVRALVVLSAGFAEAGEEGRLRQAELLRICRASGMRLIGPNCIGVVNTDPAVRLNAIFGPQTADAGPVAFASQSGALGLAVIDYAARRGIGISSFVSTGNKADISGNDLLNYWADDPRTQVILLYLESFGNPRKFARIARRVGRQKPIVVVKSGRSAAGARATTSHTGALLAASDITVDALFRQAGVIRTDTLEQLFDVASVLVNQPLPEGGRVGIVTNVGGPGILCADACEAAGLEVPLLTAQTQVQLRAVLPTEASVANPVDMIATATAEQYRQAIDLVARDPNVDAVIAVFLRPLTTRAEDVAFAVVEAARALRRPNDTSSSGTPVTSRSPGGSLENGQPKPILAVFMSSEGAPAALNAFDVRVPSFTFPEEAAIALAHAVRYARWRCAQAAASPAEPKIRDGLRRDEAAAVVALALARSSGGGWLTPDEVAQLFACYGLPLVEQRTVSTPEEAGRAAAELGGEVVLKAVVPGLVHKSDAGAVRLHLSGQQQTAAAAREMVSHLAAVGYAPAGFVIQRMVPAGVELLAGIVHDPQFGPVIACGAGGVLVELLKDVAIRLTPLTRDEAAAMLRELKSYPLLTGYRGRPPCDVEALIDVLLRVAAMADDLPQIAELDCNPIVALPDGAWIVDARVRVAPAEPPRPLSARR
jgi:acetyl coenzyme A synthetase (ADP forming)-like protein